MAEKTKWFFGFSFAQRALSNCRCGQTAAWTRTKDSNPFSPLLLAHSPQARIHITMARAPRNTKRGSQVAQRRHKKEQTLRALFAKKEAGPALSLRSLARDHHLLDTTMYNDAGAATAAQPMQPVRKQRSRAPAAATTAHSLRHRSANWQHSYATLPTP
jgi:hypothetical protein